MNIFLIGYRGTGKSTVARLLAQQLGWQMVDADEEIERRAGKAIVQIFEEDGEGVFRDLESHVVFELTQLDRHIIALGGGAVMRKENRLAIAGRGHAIWLQADTETILSRISADSTTAERRPNLTTGGGLTEIEELLAQRELIYRQSADLEVDTEGKMPAEVADEIARWIAEK